MNFKTAEPSCKLGYELAPGPGPDVCITKLNDFQLIGINVLSSSLSFVALMLGLTIAKIWLKK
jgi:hypothetical protein